MSQPPESGLSRFLREHADEMRTNPTESERWVWQLLRDSKPGAEFQTQVPMFRFILDFYCQEWKLCVELDGKYHRTYNRAIADKDRDAVLAHYGIKTLRLPSSLIFKSPEAVLRLIRQAAGVNMFPESEYPKKRKRIKDWSVAGHQRMVRKRVWGLSHSISNPWKK